MSKDNDSEERRYWVNDPAGPDAPMPLDGGVLFAIVDEEQGGEIAYCMDRSQAERIAEALNYYNGMWPEPSEPDTRRMHEKHPEMWEETEPGSGVFRYKGKPFPLKSES